MKSPSRFIGRSGEIERLTAAIGATRPIAVVGPAGIGKTTLIRQAIRLAREKGMTVLTARGGILEQDLEYGVVRQMVEEQVIRSSPEDRERLLAGPAPPAAAVLRRCAGSARGRCDLRGRAVEQCRGRTRCGPARAGDGPALPARGGKGAGPRPAGQGPDTPSR